ncbi:MAG: hypothetical protein MI866_11755, partial [Bacteroidales bacterium]|nr:hypothetical protein [Bacteroidales bacterium]
MLKFIQIIVLLQGLFFLTILLKKKQEYKPVNFWLFFSTVLSVVLYALGDDNYNLFVPDANWYFFSDLLIISLLYLLIKYQVSNQNYFSKIDLLFFIPYLLYAFLQIIEHTLEPDLHILIVIPIIVISVIILGYLINMNRMILMNNKDHRWMLVFTIPYTLI